MANYVWNLPKGGGLLGGGAFARALLDNWTLSGISWIASGNPIELTLSIAGVNAAQRLLGTDAGGTSGGLQPRFRVVGDPDERRRHGRSRPPSACPRPATTGPTTASTCATRASTTTTCRSSRTSRSAAAGGACCSSGVEMFNVLNHSQFSGLNLTTNVANGAGQTGAAIFNNYTGLTVTTNVRPGGRHAPARHVLRRGQRRPRPAHHPARGEAVFLMASGHGGECAS